MAVQIDAMAAGQGYDEEGIPGMDALNLKMRYDEERAKRLRHDGIGQYLDISLSKQHDIYLEDPWVNPATIKHVDTMFPDNHVHMLILGAGWGGLLYAIRMVETGIAPEDIRIVDSAGGFGGTWYWNRYPGLACDIESYCYLPLLEETGYMPKRRYASGEEIRNYANLAAKKWGLYESAVFQTKAEKLAWHDEAKEWQVELVQKRKGEQPHVSNIRAKFVATVNGVLNWPKLPGIPGWSDYKGDVFHTSRWDYAVTGGSPADPSLSNLRDKSVAIIGTGATAIQIIPHLARWAKHLYVVQRTPAAVDDLEQRETDPDWFRAQVATSKGWQRERLKNLHQHLTTEKQPEVNLVGDGWTRAVGMCAIAGNAAGPKTMEELPAYMEKLYALDSPRQERIRRRVATIVKDSAVATKLQAWYPTWCKRPVFNHEYLETFNRENVTLIDTDGKGPDCLTKDSIMASGQSWPVDMIICATGFRAPFTGSPAQKANMTIIGSNGVSMSEEWARTGPSTQHGVLDANFPNLFLSGPWQASNSPNYLFNLDVLAKHAAYIYAEAKQRAGTKSFTVSTNPVAAEEWGSQVAMRSVPMAAIVGCTPSYFNVEGEIDRVPPEFQMIMARSGLWGHGIEDFVRVIEGWRNDGGMRGTQVEPV